MPDMELTPHAANVLRYARQESRWFGSGAVETIHLLLALLKEEDGAGAKALTRLGVNVKKLRLALEGTAPEKLASAGVELPFSENLDKVLTTAAHEARQSPDLRVGTEHLLLGLLVQPCRAGTILRRFEVDPDKVRQIIPTLKSEMVLPELNQAGPSAVADLQLASALNSPDASRQIYRILDANLNRAGEALRVIEDCARFVLDHPLLTQEAKALRHLLRHTLERMGVTGSELLAARDTVGDVGTMMTGVAEMRRADLAALLRANFRRLQESLRTIEEYTKLLGKPFADFERLRYDAYTLEKSFAVPPPKRASLDVASLCVLVSHTKAGRPALEVLQEVLDGGCRMVQLREKELSDREFLDLALKFRHLTHQAGALLIINDRADVARRVGADGLHVGQTDLPLHEARHIVGFDRVIGVSTHSADQAAEAEAAGADYIGVGPIFLSPTKPHLRDLGPELIRQVSSIRLPFFAIGGITTDNLPRVLAVGASRVAVGAAIVESPDICETTHTFIRALRGT